MYLFVSCSIELAMSHGKDSPAQSKYSCDIAPGSDVRVP
jgi:hypothetical protein